MNTKNSAISYHGSMVPLPFLKKWNPPWLYIRPDLEDYQNKVIAKTFSEKKSKILALKKSCGKNAFFLSQYDFIQKRLLKKSPLIEEKAWVLGTKDIYNHGKSSQLFLNIPFQIMLIYELILFLFNIPAIITLIERSLSFCNYLATTFLQIW